ncbi:MAG: hypothetical protein JJT77_07735 [Crocinitomicaceae bacterium]|nr:hypothetical protein [Crocinitomicaceae bacterium]
MKKRHKQKFIAWGFMVWGLLNIPLILAYSGKFVLLGIPSFYFLVFSIWTLSILFTFIWLKRFGE